MSFPIPVDLTVDQSAQRFQISVAEAQTPVAVGMESPIVVGTAHIYDGPYEATPSSETQTFQTENKKMEQNFVVNPIPSYYGLITWNGSVITVS